MNFRRVLVVSGLVALGIGLVVGFLQILEKRMLEGDVYPHYSSYRSDPLGTSALFESLDAMSGIGVRRNVKHLNQVTSLDEYTTILLLGYPRDEFSEVRAPKDSPVLKAVEEGARLVITLNPHLVDSSFRPVRSREEEDWYEKRKKLRERKIREEQSGKVKGKEEKEVPEAKEESEEEVSKEKKEKAQKKDSEAEEEELDEEEKELEKQMEEALGPVLAKYLNFEVSSEIESDRPDSGWEPEKGVSVSADTLPDEVPLWYSPYRFKALGKSWRTVLEVDDKPVVIERTLGKGTVVLASDSYFLSNEALHLGAEPGFLLWLLGSSKQVVFDETIHGTQETGGAMKLIRRYRLHGFFFGLLAFVVLWAWRSASPLSPGSEELDRGLIDSGGMVAGEDTGAGFINLLRRSVPSKALLQQCLSTWKTSTHAPVSVEQQKEIDAVSSRHLRDPKKFGVVDAYRAVCEVLRKR